MKRLLIVLATTLLLTATAHCEDLLGWFNNLDHEQQVSRLEAMRTTKEVTMANTDDNFTKYLKKWLGLDSNEEAYEKKNVSCFTGADALMEELKTYPAVADEFDMKLYNTGVNVYGRSIPIPHFTIKMTPKNGVGPSYIADRYLGGDFAQILDWEEADLTEYVIEIYARTYPIADSDFDRMEDMVKPAPPEEPVDELTPQELAIIDALITGIPLVGCTRTSLFSGQLPGCPIHACLEGHRCATLEDGTRGMSGPHCTIGSSKHCFVHGVGGIDHDLPEYNTQ